MLSQSKRWRRTLGFIVVLLMLGLSMPLWASEILMSQAGLANWLQQATLPFEQKLSTVQTKTNEFENSLRNLDSQIISEILLKPGDTSAQLSGLGQSQQKVLDVAPVIRDGRTLVPLRFIGEVLGAEVIWQDATRQVIYRSSNRQITLTVDSNQALVDGQAIQLAVPPVVVQERTMVPLRFISEWLGAVVRWDENARTVLIRYYKG